MFTVVIAEKKHIKKIEEYKTFLEPLLDDKKFKFCQWNPLENTIEKAIPQLYETVGSREAWRAVVVADGLDISSKNPYDISKYVAVENDYVDNNAFLKKDEDNRMQAYEKAAKNPLTILAQQLCRQIDEVDASDEAIINRDLSKEDWPEQKKFNYRQYQLHFKCKKYKNQLLRGYFDEKLKIVSPTKIFCITPRNFESEGFDINQSWEIHDEVDYSEFCEYNMYPDKMRFLIFDQVSENHYAYNFDYIRFLYTILVLAGHEVPYNAIRFQKVYKIKCNNNEEALADALTAYNSKLKATIIMLDSRIRRLTNIQKKTIGEKEFEDRYLTPKDISLLMDSDIDVSEMKAEYKGIGLARDFPKDEKNYWGEQEYSTKRALKRYLKQPRRTVNRAAEKMKKEDNVDVDDVLNLNEYQIDDIRDFANDQEQKLSETATSNIYDLSKYNDALEEESKNIYNIIDTRMTKRTIGIVTLIALISVFVGFIPFVVNGAKSVGSTFSSLMIVLAGLGLILLSGVVALFVFKRNLISAIKAYNHKMVEIESNVRESVTQFGKYLSHAQTMRDSNEEILVYETGEVSSTVIIRNYKKHKKDIEAIIKNNNSLFQQVIKEEYSKKIDMEPYDLDFKRKASNEYKLPLGVNNKKKIDYIQKENKIELPVDFIDSILITREEIYD